MKVIAIVPCYKSSKIAPSVVNDLLEYVDNVICIDDNCPDKTGHEIEKLISDSKLIVTYHNKNKGVGGATKTGIKLALTLNADLILKIDSDGQMDPRNIPKLIEPIINSEVDFTKGNRFRDVEVLMKMPKIRLIGNIALGFITKLSTGYWELFDPTNGFIAINTKILNTIQYEKTDDRYFFESDLLFRCGLYDILIGEISMPTIYKNEKSGLNPLIEFFRYIPRHIIIFIKRILYQYFLLDFNPGSITILIGLFSGLYTLTAGLKSITYYNNLNIESPLGIKILFLTTAIISVQSIISFLYYDSTQRQLKRQLKSLERNAIKRN